MVVGDDRTNRYLGKVQEIMLAVQVNSIYDKEQILEMEICECGAKSVAQAIEIFGDTALPYKKAKKLVTECEKSCCRAALLRLFDMSYFGTFDYEEIERLIQLRHDKLGEILERMKTGR